MAKKMPAQKRHQSNQEVATPDEFVTAACRRLNIKKFAWDLAASESNVIIGCGPGRGGEGRYFDKEDNSLVQPWPKYGWNWLNPEFADIEPWAQRCCEQADQGASIAMLVPASPGANWWVDYVDDQAYVLFLQGRVKFKGHKDQYPKDLALCLYVPWQAVGYQIWDWKQELKRDA